MEFIIEDNCYNIEAVETITPYIKPIIDNVLTAHNISTLDYFVIADSIEENCAEAVRKYASVVGTDTHNTQDGSYITAGKSLDGIDDNGHLNQAIIIKSANWVFAAYEYLDTQGLLKDGVLEQTNIPKFSSLLLVLHEIGHAIDNEQQYKISGTVNTKVFYDLDYEYDEYVQNTALSLWGEYFAESFAFQVIRIITKDAERTDSELEKCVNAYSIGTDRNTLLNRVYRILYLFVTRIAYIHQTSNFRSTFNYSKYEEDDLYGLYIPILAKTEGAILKLYRNYPCWKSYKQLGELSDIFKEFVLFEYQRQMG